MDLLGTVGENHRGRGATGVENEGTSRDLAEVRAKPKNRPKTRAGSAAEGGIRTLGKCGIRDDSRRFAYE
jgi:hypothetical protein